VRHCQEGPALARRSDGSALPPTPVSTAKLAAVHVRLSFADAYDITCDITTDLSRLRLLFVARWPLVRNCGVNPPVVRVTISISAFPASA
jgi:hypothetical protein